MDSVGNEPADGMACSSPEQNRCAKKHKPESIRATIEAASPEGIPPEMKPLVDIMDEMHEKRRRMREENKCLKANIDWIVRRLLTPLQREQWLEYSSWHRSSR